MKLRERRRRESAPLIGVADPDQAHSVGGLSQQVRGARRVSKGSQRAMLVSCLSEDSALEGLESVGEIHTPKGSRRNFIELMMSSSPQVGPLFCFRIRAHKTVQGRCETEATAPHRPDGRLTQLLLHILGGRQLPLDGTTQRSYRLLRFHNWASTPLFHCIQGPFGHRNCQYSIHECDSATSGVMQWGDLTL